MYVWNWNVFTYEISIYEMFTYEISIYEMFTYGNFIYEVDVWNWNIFYILFEVPSKCKKCRFRDPKFNLFLGWHTPNPPRNPSLVFNNVTYPPKKILSGH